MTAYYKRSKKKFVTGCSLLLCCMCIACAGGSVKDTPGEYRLDGAGQIPFILRYPAGLPDSTDKLLSEDQQHMSVKNRWVLARYYHLQDTTDGHLRRAIQQYESIASSNKKERMLSLTNKACALSQMGMYRESEQLFQALVEEGSSVITTYYNLHILYRVGERQDDEIMVLTVMHDRFPESIYPLVELGNIYSDKEDYKKAELFYVKAVNTGSGNPVPLYKLALLKERIEEYADASIYYERCISEYPYFHPAYLDYSNMLLSRGEKEKAAGVLKKGMKIIEKGNK
ncbi:MAG: tetratricopeptide repeat protein [Spirochaetota bacterium]